MQISTATGTILLALAAAVLGLRQVTRATVHQGKADRAVATQTVSPRSIQFATRQPTGRHQTVSNAPKRASVEMLRTIHVRPIQISITVTSVIVERGIRVRVTILVNLVTNSASVMVTRVPIMQIIMATVALSLQKDIHATALREKLDPIVAILVV